MVWEDTKPRSKLEAAGGREEGIKRPWETVIAERCSQIPWR
jgi:hypothetical protein